MTGFFAIARREVREHRVVLVAVALASLVMPIALYFVPGPPARLLGFSAFFASFTYAAGIAIGLGATSVAPGIATRRVGFDFARPLSAFDIWGGRIAGAALLAVAAAILPWIPASIGRAHVPWNDLLTAPTPPRAWPLVALAGFAVLFALVHAVALAVRSRSGLIVVDVALALVCALLVSAAFSRLPLYRAEAPFRRLAVGLAIAAGVAFLAAGYASVARGRSDARASHRALSSVLWTGMGIAVVAANAYAGWVSAAKPRNLREGFWATPAANGPWVTLSGPARGAEATFVYDAVDGRSARALTPDWRGPILSRDGKHAAWIEARRRGPYPIWTWNLEAAGSRPARTRLALESYPYLMVLAEDGSRLATWEAGIVSVYDFAEQRVLAAAHVPSGERQRLEGIFVSRDVFRVYRADDRAIDLLQLDVRARSLATLGRIEGVGGLRSFVADAHGERLLALDTRNLGVRLFSASSGALLATLADGPAEGRWPEFLPDGRIVLSEQSTEGRRLRVFAADGREGTAIPLPPASSVILGGEVAPGQVCIGLADAQFRYASWIADLDTSTLRRVAEDLRPAAPFRTTAGLGSDATKLFYGPGQRSLVHFDPLSGQRRTLLEGP
jgi:hypothetical protein